MKSSNKLKTLVDIAVTNKMPALALADYNTLSGALEFSEYAVTKGIQPIIGLNLTIKYQLISSEILLLAKNETGYKNLIYLSGLVSQSKIAFSKLLEHTDGLIVLSGNLLVKIIKNKNADIKEFVTKLKNQLKSDFFIEIQRVNKNFNIEEELINIAYKENLPIVATNEILFASRDDLESHEVLTCIANTSYISNQDREKVSPECYFKTTEEMCELFSDIKEAINNTILIAKKCTFMPEVRNPILPKFLCKTTEDEELENKSKAGLKARLVDEGNREYSDRLQYELEIITKMKYSGYFLIVADFINWSKKNNIPVGPGRGDRKSVV